MAKPFSPRFYIDINTEIMREIKFEYGFESVNGTVKKVYSLSQIPNIKKLCDVWDQLPITYVREYLGMKDKNGKECFEGDIYRNHENGLVGVLKMFKSIAGYEIYCEEKKDGQLYNYMPFSQMDLTDFEVIGNIHENLKLLKP